MSSTTSSSVAVRASRRGVPSVTAVDIASWNALDATLTLGPQLISGIVVRVISAAVSQ
jgi:hypothetical protein